MGAKVNRSGLRNEADGEFEMPRNNAAILKWSQIAIAVYNENNQRVTDTSTVTGMISGRYQIVGEGKINDFDNPINLASDKWNFRSELAYVESFYFRVTGLNEGHFFEITVTSSE